MARLTSNLVVDVDDMEGLAANGAAVRLVGPLAQTSIVQHVAAHFDLGYMVVVDVLQSVLLLVCAGECFGILNGKAFVVLLVVIIFEVVLQRRRVIVVVLLLWVLPFCRAQRGRAGLDVQGLQTDDALISHGRWQIE